MNNWTIPRDIDRLELNAALTRLTEVWSPEAAELVIKAFHTMPRFEGKTEATYSSSVGKSTDVTGHTAEHGNMNIDVPEEKKALRFGVNQNIVRLGSFKIHRWSGRDADGLVFGQFWASDITTMGEDDPPHWVLEFDAETLIPNEFSRHDIVPADLSVFERVMRFFVESVGGTFELYTCTPTTLYSREEREVV